MVACSTNIYYVMILIASCPLTECYVLFVCSDLPESLLEHCNRTGQTWCIQKYKVRLYLFSLVLHSFCRITCYRLQQISVQVARATYNAHPAGLFRGTQRQMTETLVDNEMGILWKEATVA
jgi:hypothetical protein